MSAGATTVIRRAAATLLLAAMTLLVTVSCGDETTGDTAVPAATMTAATIPSLTQPPPVSPPPSDINILLGAYNSDRQFFFLETLADDLFQGRLTGTAGGAAAADFIEAEFIRQGLVPWSAAGEDDFVQPFAAAGREGGNIIGIIPGASPAAGYVILAAHYDHLGTDNSGRVYNGADDNAAGVASLLETANIFRQTGIKPVKTIVLCAFDAEEQGQLGAIALGKQLTATGLAPRVEMINIDGIGATCGEYLGVWDEGFAGAAPLVSTFGKAGTLLDTPVREEGTDIGSDAQAFDWQFGIPAVTVDWHWGQDESECHPYYHTVDDDASYIDRDSMDGANRVILASLWLRASGSP